MWLRLTEIFGFAFTDKFGLEPNFSWTQAIAGLNDMQIMRGLSAIINANEKLSFAPNANEFVHLCKSHHPMDAIKALPDLCAEVRQMQSIATTYGIPMAETEGMTLEQVKDKIFEKRFGVMPGAKHD